MEPNEYFDKQRERVLKLYNKAKHQGFSSGFDLADWFVQQLEKNDCKCHYCDTSIHDIVKLIDNGLLKERKTGYGWRGRILEIDKNDNHYIMEHCVLSCYYCNNDKSYITTSVDYKKHFGEIERNILKCYSLKFINRESCNYHKDCW